MHIPTWQRIVGALIIAVALLAGALISVTRADIDLGRFMMDHFNWTFNIYLERYDIRDCSNGLVAT